MSPDAITFNPSDIVGGFFGSGGLGGMVKGMTAPAHPLDLALPMLRPMATVDLIRGQLGEAAKAYDAFKQGHYSEAAGHGAASLLPVVGPAAAHIGERIGQSGNVGRGVGETAALVGATLAAGRAPRLLGGPRPPALGTAGSGEVAAGRAAPTGAQTTGSGMGVPARSFESLFGESSQGPTSYGSAGYDLPPEFQMMSDEPPPAAAPANRPPATPLRPLQSGSYFEDLTRDYSPSEIASEVAKSRPASLKALLKDYRGEQ